MPSGPGPIDGGAAPPPDRRSGPARLLLVAGFTVSLLLGLLLCAIAVPALDAARGRHRGRVRDGDALLVESRHLAGGAALTSYVVLHAVADRTFRAALGSPASLPPG